MPAGGTWLPLASLQPSGLRGAKTQVRVVLLQERSISHPCHRLMQKEISRRCIQAVCTDIRPYSLTRGFLLWNCFFLSRCLIVQLPKAIMTLSATSRTLSPLPDILSRGLIPVATFGLLSFVCSTSLFLYLTYRLISWRRQSVVKAPVNQFLFLIYNLLLAGKNSIQLKLKLLNSSCRHPTSDCFPPKY